MPIRVLWVIKGLGPGGAEILLASGAEARDHDRFVVECAFVRPEKSHLVPRLEASGILVHSLGRDTPSGLWPIRLMRHIRRGRYDVVHVHSPLPGSVARIAALSCGRGRPRIVTTEHNSWKTFRWPTRLLNRLTSHADDATFAVSEEVRHSMAGRTRQRAVALVHGIDVAATGALRGERAAVRAEFGIGASDFVIGTVANFREQKDYPTLLRAVRAFLDSEGQATWLIVGQGPLEQQVKSLAKDLNVEQHVVFAGYRSDASRVQSAFDVFTLSSRWEGLPVALMEALALGTPVAATAVGGVAEVFKSGGSALLVPAGNPLALAQAWKQLAYDSESLERLGAEARALASNFDVLRAQRQIEATWLGVVERAVSRATRVGGD